MTSLYRIRVTWTGWPGGPGVSTFYSDPDVNLVRNPLKDLLTSAAAYIPSAIKMTILGQGDTIDDVSGGLVGQWTIGPDLVVQGTNVGGASTTSGPQIRWNTSGIHRGRHLRGRTYLIPFSAGQTDGLGTLNPAPATALQNAVNTFTAAAGANMRIWGRPVAHAGGSSSPVDSGTVPTKLAVLRSRRD